MNGYSNLRSHITPIPTPVTVRLGASMLIAIGVAVLSTSLGRGAQVGIMLACMAAACLLIFSHPYRREIRTFLDKRNLHYTPRVGQLVPLFIVWLELMLVPTLAPAPIWATILIALVTFGWMWLVFPHVDGTRVLAFADTKD